MRTFSQDQSAGDERVNDALKRAGQFLIGFWLSSVRAQMGRPIDEVAADDPLKIQFNTLHEYSVWILFTAMAAALIAFFIISNRKFVAAKAATSDVYDFSKEFKI